MNRKRLNFIVIASILLVLLQATSAFAVYYNDTSTYITGYSYVSPTYLNPNSLPQSLDVNKQTQLRSGYSPSYITQSGGIPNYNTKSMPHSSTIGIGFSGNWSVSESHSNGDQYNGSVGQGYESAIDTSRDGYIFQDLYWTFSSIS